MDNSFHSHAKSLKVLCLLLRVDETVPFADAEQAHSCVASVPLNCSDSDRPVSGSNDIAHRVSTSETILNDAPLSSVHSHKYLGLNITNNLSWQKHVEYVTNNANHMLGYLRRNFSSVPMSVKLNLYKTLVRSKLEYACAIWDPGQVTLTLTLEAVQNRAARFILCNYSRHASVTAMKKTLNLTDLSFRRKCSRLSLFHKIYHYNPSLKESLLSSPSYISPRFDHCFKVGVPFC